MRATELWQNRWVRYGAPVALIILSVLFAAADTGHVGNDVQVAGTAVGLMWLIGLLGRDMGMGTDSGRRRHVPEPPGTAPERPGIAPERPGIAPEPPAEVPNPPRGPQSPSSPS